MAVQKTKICVKCKKSYQVIESQRQFANVDSTFTMKTTNGFPQGSPDEILHSLFCPTCREEKRAHVEKFGK